MVGLQQKLTRTSTHVHTGRQQIQPACEGSFLDAQTEWTDKKKCVLSVTKNAHRAILFDETTCDRVLSNAAQSSFISQFERRLPAEAVVMWVDPGSVSVKFLTSQKVKILYDSTDPAFSKDVSAPAGSTPAAGAAASSTADPSPVACAQEYSSHQAAAAVTSIPAQRV